MVNYSGIVAHTQYGGGLPGFIIAGKVFNQSKFAKGAYFGTFSHN
jgi:hypothetical protein